MLKGPQSLYFGKSATAGVVSITTNDPGEEKDGRIEIPYLHAAAAGFGFGAPPLISGLEFDDSNLSPEAAINYHLTEDVSVYFAYKQGFKSGGLDNSALPTAALQPTNPAFPDFLIYQSEEAEGFEVGLKGRFLGSALRFNATAFSYEYSDLQVQLFDSTIIQFQTFNASALETEGVEFDMLWNTDVEGLVVRSAWAWTDTVYSEDGRHEFNLIGRNVTDEIYVISAGAIPGRCPNATPERGPFATCNDTGPNSLDQAATTPLGRTIGVQYRFTM